MKSQMLSNSTPRLVFQYGRRLRNSFNFLFCWQPLCGDVHHKQPSHFIFFSWRPFLLILILIPILILLLLLTDFFRARFAGNETYRNTVNTPIYNIENFSQDSGPRRNTCHLDQDFYTNPRVSRPILQTRGYITTNTSSTCKLQVTVLAGPKGRKPSLTRSSPPPRKEKQ